MQEGKGLTWGAQFAVAGGIVGPCICGQLLKVLEQRCQGLVRAFANALADQAEPDLVLGFDVVAVIGHDHLIHPLLRSHMHAHQMYTPHSHIRELY